jgi:hypothetical protein
MPLSLCIAIHEGLCGARSLPDEAPEPPQRHHDQKEQRVMQTKPPSKAKVTAKLNRLARIPTIRPLIWPPQFFEQP